ncbi:hypothetical protein GCM10029964_007450 [Kibdelosporangium lantanae]
MTTTAMVGIAQPPPPGPDDPGGRGEDFGKSSPLGLLVLLAFLIAVVFLARSMSKHLKRVPASFDKPEDNPRPTTYGPTRPTRPTRLGRRRPRRRRRQRRRRTSPRPATAPSRPPRRAEATGSTLADGAE